MDDFQDRIDTALDIIGKDASEETAEPAIKELAAAENAEGQGTELPTENTEEVIGEDTKEDKPSEEVKDEQAEESAIEPPVSWPSDDKEAFKALPTWAQQRIVARENEREAYFTERSKTTAAKERDATDLAARSTEAQNRYLSELSRLNELATTLLPAQFQDIKSEADYLNLKRTDPARASEYEAFTQVLGKAKQQQAQLEQQRMTAHLNNEYQQLSEKFSEFKDPAKSETILNNVRKGAVDYYGFRPEEVKIIMDHRYVPVLRDAMAWRQYQANIKTAAAKKLAPQPTTVLRTTGNASAAVGADKTKQVLNRVRSADSLEKKADMLMSIL